jgi:outer membrane murein-binding lipoprotein Lpp
MLLKRITYPENELNPNLQQLSSQLKQIRNQIYGAGKTKE